ncbi:MAG: nucleotidyltransferase domain-containing protein [Pseudomonadota bacterium]
MINLIENNYNELQILCSRYNVKSLELIGSATKPESFHQETSDLDFLVDFLPLEAGKYADAYFGLLEALENLFQRHIDLLMIRAVKNPYFLQAINQTRKLLYAA